MPIWGSGSVTSCLTALSLRQAPPPSRRIHVVPCDWAHGLTGIAVMENGAERFIVQLKKVRPTEASETETNVRPLRHRVR